LSRIVWTQIVFATQADSKSGALQLEDTRLRDAAQLEKLYLVAAVALLYGTLIEVTVQFDGLPQQVDPHWNRGLSYLKIGLRWLQAVVAKNRPLFELSTLPNQAPQPCFASVKAHQAFYDQIWIRANALVVLQSGLNLIL
jgi:hypothetical protein